MPGKRNDGIPVILAFGRMRPESCCESEADLEQSVLREKEGGREEEGAAGCGAPLGSQHLEVQQDRVQGQLQPSRNLKTSLGCRRRNL